MTKSDTIAAEEVPPEETHQEDPDHFTVELTIAIPVYTEKLKTLKMRNPNGADMIAVGNPVKVIFDDSGSEWHIEHNYKRVQGMISRLANIPAGSVERMDSKDLVACAVAMQHVFTLRPGQA